MIDHVGQLTQAGRSFGRTAHANSNSVAKREFAALVCRVDLVLEPPFFEVRVSLGEEQCRPPLSFLEVLRREPAVKRHAVGRFQSLWRL